MIVNRSKSDILTAIQEALRGIWHPEEIRSVPHGMPHLSTNFEEIGLRCFQEMLQAAGGEGHILADEEAALSVLRGILGEVHGHDVIVPPDPELGRLAVPRFVEESGSRVLVPGQVALEQVAKAPLGITTADAGIADTGTIVLLHTLDKGRLAALLPPIHTVMLKRERVYADKKMYLDEIRKRADILNTTPMTWVTGPSLTADIEKVLVRGAHGPRRLIVLLY